MSERKYKVGDLAPGQETVYDILDSAKGREGGSHADPYGVAEGEAGRPRATHNLCLKLFRKLAQVH